MHFDEKIEKISERLNQYGIAYDQQRSNDKNSYKYTPMSNKNSYKKYGLPTVKAAKVKGAPFQPNGISSDEEIVIKGFGVIDRSQAEKLLDDIKQDIHELVKRNVTGAILKSKLDLYASIIQQMS